MVPNNRASRLLSFQNFFLSVYLHVIFTKKGLHHTDRILIEMFQNHDFKEWVSLKIMLLWLCKVIRSLFNHVR